LTNEFHAPTLRQHFVHWGCSMGSADMPDIGPDATLSDQVLAIQLAYPKIWFACHRRHQTRGQNTHGLTDRDLGVLAHLSDPELAADLGRLARHLGIGKSALTTHLRRLENLGAIEQVIPEQHLNRKKTAPHGDQSEQVQAAHADRRRKHFVLTDVGRRWLHAHGPLDPTALGAMLATLAVEQRACAVVGLKLLAQAASTIGIDAKSRSEI
jgi:DNA-binding MarR family transcriptional regulator